MQPKLQEVSLEPIVKNEEARNSFGSAAKHHTEDLLKQISVADEAPLIES